MEARLIKIFLICCLVSVTSLLKSDVYWLRDIGKSIKLNTAKSADVEGILKRDIFLEEKIIINGFSTSMEVGNSAYKFSELIHELERIDSRLITIIDDSNLVFTIDLNDKYVQKYLVSALGENFNAVVFSMKLPKILPAPKWQGNWETLLGNGSSELEKIIEYPSRKTLYISLKNVTNPMMEMDYIRRNLQAKGFKSFSNDAKDFQEQSDILLKNSTGEIISIAFDDAGGGLFYYRKGQKWE